jgi:hypothetical protein
MTFETAHNRPLTKLLLEQLQFDAKYFWYMFLKPCGIFRVCFKGKNLTILADQSCCNKAEETDMGTYVVENPSWSQALYLIVEL